VSFSSKKCETKLDLNHNCREDSFEDKPDKLEIRYSIS
jgi:hypothetical protein